MAHICHGKNIVQFGPSFITNLLQIGASLKEASWFQYGKVFPLLSKCNHYLFSPCIFLYKKHGTTWYPCWNLYLFGVHLAFYTLIEFPRHLMSIIQIWTTNTCSSSPKWLENYTCVLGCMFRFHARNGNELQPYRRPGSSSNIWNLGF